MNRSKQRGTAAETAVVEYLRNNGFPFAERRALAGGKDKGDIAGIPGIVIEVKACKAMDLAGWIKEATIEAENADTEMPRQLAPGLHCGVVWHKRRGKSSPGDWYVTMDGTTFCRLIR